MTCVPRRYFAADGLPGAGRELFQSQRELARGAIDLENFDFDLIARFEQVVGLGDPSPAHLTDRQQAVDAADIDESAEALDRANDAVVHLPFLERFPGALAELGPFLFQKVAARDDEVLLALIGLGDEGLEFLIDVGRGILDPREVDLADWQEAADAVDVDFEPALDGLGHSGFDDHALSQGVPVGVDGRAFSAQDLDSFFGIETVDDHLDRRARQRQVALELVDRENSLALTTEIDEDALAANADDLAGSQARADFLATVCLGAARACVARRRAAGPSPRMRDRTRPGQPRAPLPGLGPTVA